jgi:hypothetical protein
VLAPVGRPGVVLAPGVLDPGEVPAAGVLVSGEVAAGLPAFGVLPVVPAVLGVESAGAFVGLVVGRSPVRVGGAERGGRGVCLGRSSGPGLVGVLMSAPRGARTGSPGVRAGVVPIVSHPDKAFPQPVSRPADPAG